MQLHLISKENWNGFPQKNRRNKNRSFYSWKLTKYSCSNQNNEIEIHFFPSSSETRGIQIIKTEILSKLNQSKIFDFEYIPEEFDYLEIINLKDSDEYLNLIYRNGKWEEEIYIYSKRSFFDLYTDFKNGFFELIQ